MIVLSAFASGLLYEIKGKATNIATDTWPGLYLSSQISTVAETSINSVYHFVLSSSEAGRQQSLTEIRGSQAKLDSLIADYSRTSFRDEDRRLLQSIKTTREACETAYKPIVETTHPLRAEEAEAVLSSRIEPASSISQAFTYHSRAGQKLPSSACCVPFSMSARTMFR